MDEQPRVLKAWEEHEVETSKAAVLDVRDAWVAEDHVGVVDDRDTLDLICIRCGDNHRRQVGDPYTPELCSSCFSKGLEILFGPDGSDTNSRRYDRWRARWEKHADKHPTTRKLAAAWAEYTKDDPPADDDFPF